MTTVASLLDRAVRAPHDIVERPSKTGGNDGFNGHSTGTGGAGGGVSHATTVAFHRSRHRRSKRQLSRDDECGSFGLRGSSRPTGAGATPWVGGNGVVAREGLAHRPAATTHRGPIQSGA